MAEILGEDPKPYRTEAEAILKAMNDRLWLSDRGHWAEYQDLMGYKRKHESAALWSIYTPIDCGVTTDEQAWLSTQYVIDNIPHIPVTAWKKAKAISITSSCATLLVLQSYGIQSVVEIV